jgi:hypothetical protein
MDIPLASRNAFGIGLTAAKLTNLAAESPEGLSPSQHAYPTAGATRIQSTNQQINK